MTLKGDNLNVTTISLVEEIHERLYIQLSSYQRTPKTAIPYLFTYH